VTEMGHGERLAAWVVRWPEDVPDLATLGVDPLHAAFDAGALGKLLSDARGQIKRVLTDQRLIAGVGNAYSDEALHAARLSPFKPGSNLTPEEVERLHDALVEVLRDAVAGSNPVVRSSAVSRDIVHRCPGTSFTISPAAGSCGSTAEETRRR